MSPTEHLPQPLEMRPWLWIALALIAITGVANWKGAPDPLRTIDHLNTSEIAIVRQVAKSHVFSTLGIKVETPDGWTYLSVTDDSIADQPTFVNASTDTIVSVRPFRFREWPPIPAEITKRESPGFVIEWVKLDHRRAGRISTGDVDVVLLVLTHRHKSRLNSSVTEFCEAISPIPAAE